MGGVGWSGWGGQAGCPGYEGHLDTTCHAKASTKARSIRRMTSAVPAVGGFGS